MDQEECQKRKKRIEKMLGEGRTLQEAGDSEGISRQRVHQILKGNCVSRITKMKRARFIHDEGRCQLCMYTRGETGERAFVFNFDIHKKKHELSDLMTVHPSCLRVVEEIW